jgi:hypothetical protein
MHDHVMKTNANFQVEQEQEKARVKIDKIIRRHMTKKRENSANIKQAGTNVTVNLVNLALWLLETKLPTFVDWIDLNNAVKEELDGISLRELQMEEHNTIFQLLTENYTRSFLLMSEQDERGLENYKRLFKLHCKKSAILAYMFGHFNFNKPMANEQAKWLTAYGAYAFCKVHLLKTEVMKALVNQSLEVKGLMDDVAAVFLLSACLNAMRAVQKERLEDLI